MTVKTTFLTVRLPQELKAQVAALAKREERTASQQVLLFIKQGLAANKEPQFK
jgi:hypothetical protein